VHAVPGSIQSIERAVAVLRLLASTDRPLGLAELAAALDLPRPTVHGIVRTLRDVEFVVQEAGGGSRYRLAPALHGLGGGGLDQHDLRAGAMNWADALAGSTGLAVQVGAVAGRNVRLVHHVFRPDGSPQRLRIGEELPLHATALGKCLLAFAPVATPPVRDLELARWTGRTCTTVAALDAHLAAARQRGWASDLGEYEAGVGAAAAPLRASGGTVVGALSVLGPVEELFGVGGELRRPIAEQLVADAREVSGALLQAHASAEWQGRT
jgi:DNA-binding IclR family transcriptional regulator